MNEFLFEASIDGISIDRVVRTYDFSMPTRHFHNEYEIYYLVEGERYYFINNQTYHIHKGCLVLIDKYCLHKTSQVQGTGAHERYLIELKDKPFSNFLNSIGELSLEDFFKKYNGVVELSPSEQLKMEDLFQCIESEIKDKKEGYQTLIWSKVAEILICTQRLQSLSSPANNNALMPASAIHKQINVISNYISEHYRDDISLDSISNRFFISKSYLSRKYKEITGLSISEHINIQRIKYSADLLSHSSDSITVVAAMSGYNSITYFEKTFKRYTGLSPRQYRKNIQDYLSPVISPFGL